MFAQAEPLFVIFSQEISLLHLGTLLVSWIVAFSLYHIVASYLLPALFEREKVKKERQTVIRRWFLVLLLLTLIVFAIRALDLDLVIFADNDFTIRLSGVFLALSILVVARFLDWYIAKVLLHKYYLRRNEMGPTRSIQTSEDPELKASRIVQYILYAIVAIVIIRSFDLNYSLFTLNGGETGVYDFRVTSILSVVLILLAAKLIAWIFTQLVLYSYYQRRNIDPGRRYAVNQLITYFIYVIAVFMAIDNLGIEMTVLWGGIAALLVGIGLGLQEIFRDLMSGIILLFERTVEVGDVVEIGDEGPGHIRKIGLRTSLMHTRNDTMAIVPNSQLISTNVVNWSHTNKNARFSINVGVAYGSDPRRVQSILEKVANAHPQVEEYPNPFVRFSNFSDSALVFDLYFWSGALMNIDDVKSDLRFDISERFLSNNIAIPFPQMDVWVKRSDSE